MLFSQKKSGLISCVWQNWILTVTKEAAAGSWYWTNSVSTGNWIFGRLFIRLFRWTNNSITWTRGADRSYLDNVPWSNLMMNIKENKSMNGLNLMGEWIIKQQAFLKSIHGQQARWATKNQWKSLCWWDYLRVLFTDKINANLCEHMNLNQVTRNRWYKRCKFCKSCGRSKHHIASSTKYSLLQANPPELVLVQRHYYHGRQADIASVVTRSDTAPSIFFTVMEIKMEQAW